MAVIKAARGSASGKGLGKAIDYAAHGKEKEHDRDDREHLTRGINCDDDPKRALEQMKATKEMYGKEGGREYKHYIQSFKPGEISPEKALDISAELAKDKFPGHEVFLGVHTDKEHIHVHMVVNSVNFEDGHKIQLPKDFLEELKSHSDRLCRFNDLSTIDRTQKPDRGQVRTYDMNKYQAMAQGKSYIPDIYIAVDNALEKSKDKGFEAFKENMEAQGYSVDLRGNKHITFADQDGNKVRGATLAKDFADDRMSRDGIMKTLGVERQIDKPQPQQTIELPKMKTIQEIKRETNSLDRNSPVKSMTQAQGQTVSRGGAGSPAPKTPSRSQAPSQPPRGGGGMSGKSGGLDLDELIAQGYSKEAAQKILDMQDGFKIELTGTGSDSVLKDLAPKKEQSRGMSFER